jgi:hypothetical protein
VVPGFTFESSNPAAQDLAKFAALNSKGRIECASPRLLL